MAEAPVGTNGGRRNLYLDIAVVVVLMIVAGFLHRDTMRGPLVEEHAFRQTQTALTAVDFKAHGIDLLHPRLPVFGPASEVPFEFPLFQALATIPMNLGVRADVALRLTSFACFLLTAALLFGLIRRVGGRAAAFGTLIAFLFSPFGLLWSRTSMIEYLATACAVGFTWAGIEWREKRSWSLLAIAVLAGSLAMMVKVTTAAFWLFPVILYTTRRRGGARRDWITERRSPGLATIIVLPILAGVWWTGHADAIKNSQVATRWLTSSGLRQWNFGTFSQRLVAKNWSTVFGRMETLLLGRFIVIVLAVVALWLYRRQGFWWGMLIVVVLTPAVFFNLYVVHDYYLAAVSPALAGFVGLAAKMVWEHRPRRLPKAVIAAALAAGWAVWTIWPAAGYVEPMYGAKLPNPSLDLASELKGVAHPGEKVLVRGAAWDPTILYYGEFDGFMLDPRSTPRSVLESLPSQDYDVLLVVAPTARSIQVLERWPWVGLLGGHTYALGGQRSDVERAPVVARTGDVPVDSGAHGWSSLPCDGSRVELPAVAWQLRIDPRSIGGRRAAKMRIWVRDDLAPLPPVNWIESSGAGWLHCSGGGPLAYQLRTP